MRFQGKVYKFSALQVGSKMVFMHDPAVIKHVIVTGFQDGRYGKGKDFSDQYMVRGRVTMRIDCTLREIRCDRPIESTLAAPSGA